MPPSKDQYTVALKVLRDEAKDWDDVSDDLAAARRAAAALDLDEFQFTYVGEKLGIAQAYTDVQAKMIKLLGQGVDTADDTAKALRASADTYEDQERKGIHRLKKIY
jgi:uncharacterized protein YukE